MSEEPTDPDKPRDELRILGGNSLSKPAGSGSRAINEMVDRSLVHIQTSKELSKLHRIGEHELCTPDYQLVCAWAEQCELEPEVVMHALTFDKRLAKAFWE